MIDLDKIAHQTGESRFPLAYQAGYGVACSRATLKAASDALRMSVSDLHSLRARHYLDVADLLLEWSGMADQ